MKQFKLFRIKSTKSLIIQEVDFVGLISANANMNDVEIQFAQELPNQTHKIAIAKFNNEKSAKESMDFINGGEIGDINYVYGTDWMAIRIKDEE